jgi:hypothetical protein
MVLEKYKVYKIFHNPISFLKSFPREYVLVCPNRNVFIPDDFVKGKTIRYGRIRYSHQLFNCLFIVCFDGSFSFNHDTSISEDSYLEPLNDGDLEDIRKALNGIIGGKYKYNRKLNAVIKL